MRFTRRRGVATPRRSPLRPPRPAPECTGEARQVSGHGLELLDEAEFAAGAGVPVKLGASGLEEVVEITLSSEEQAMLQKSVDAVEELVGVMHSSTA